MVSRADTRRNLMRNSITTFMIPVLEESLDDRRVAQGNDWLGKRAVRPLAFGVAVGPEP